jgi:hypothetical protein
MAGQYQRVLCIKAGIQKQRLFALVTFTATWRQAINPASWAGAVSAGVPTNPHDKKAASLLKRL